ncbi:MAG: hypothetical protein FWH37_01410 [Candidatus Bathyarchaeota archaeon]|nr:hypothetical protein [Candidatus Termiticorpusculum sp.]
MDLSIFKTDSWDGLKRDEKIAALRELEHKTPEEQGREKVRIVVEDKLLSAGTFGHYCDKRPCKLYINSCYLDSKEPLTNYAAMATVIHEGRHAYQDDVINLDNERKLIKIYEIPSKATLHWWIINSKIYNDEQDNFIFYRFQPREFDAFNYAHYKMKAFKAQFGNDVYYNHYIEQRTLEIESEINEAIRAYTKKYRQVIADDLFDSYKVYVRKKQKTLRFLLT